jgi:hypothetical protein
LVDETLPLWTCRVVVAVDDLSEAPADQAILMKTRERGSPANDTRPAAGCFRCGLPYNRQGRGRGPRVIVQGLTLENKR